MNNSNYGSFRNSKGFEQTGYSSAVGLNNKFATMNVGGASSSPRGGYDT